MICVIVSICAIVSIVHSYRWCIIPGMQISWHRAHCAAPWPAACTNACAVCASPAWSSFSATMAVPPAERLREKNLLPLRDWKSEVWGYFGFLQHKGNQITDLSKVGIADSEDPLPIQDGDSHHENHSPIVWWKENSSRFKTLAKLARKYLCIPRPIRKTIQHSRLCCYCQTCLP